MTASLPPGHNKIVNAFCSIRTLFGCFVAIFFVSFITTARGDVEFSTFGPGDSFSGSAGTTANGYAVSGSVWEANAFKANFSGMLSSIEVAVSGSVTPPSLFDISLSLNNPVANQPLASSQVLLGTLTAPKGLGSILSLAVTVPYTLVASTNYWLILSPHDANANVTWNKASDPSLASAVFSSDGGGTYTTRPGNNASAFRIDAVPEPSTWALVALGAMGMGAQGLRRRRASA